MNTIKLRSKVQEDHFLAEILEKLGNKVYISTYFGNDIDTAVKDFQSNNNHIFHCIVGLKLG